MNNKYDPDQLVEELEVVQETFPVESQEREQNQDRIIKELLTIEPPNKKKKRKENQNINQEINTNDLLMINLTDPTGEKKKKRKKTIIWIVFISVLILLLGLSSFLIFHFLFKDNIFGQVTMKDLSHKHSTRIFEPGDKVEIKYIQGKFQGISDWFYSVDNGKTFKVLKERVYSNYVIWDIPTDITNSIQCIIKIQNSKNANQYILSDTFKISFIIHFIRGPGKTPNNNVYSNMTFKLYFDWHEGLFIDTDIKKWTFEISGSSNQRSIWWTKKNVNIKSINKSDKSITVNIKSDTKSSIFWRLTSPIGYTIICPYAFNVFPNPTPKPNPDPNGFKIVSFVVKDSDGNHLNQLQINSESEIVIHYEGKFNFEPQFRIKNSNGILKEITVDITEADDNVTTWTFLPELFDSVGSFIEMTDNSGNIYKSDLFTVSPSMYITNIHDDSQFALESNSVSENYKFLFKVNTGSITITINKVTIKFINQKNETVYTIEKTTDIETNDTFDCTQVYGFEDLKMSFGSPQNFTIDYEITWNQSHLYTFKNHNVTISPLPHEPLHGPITYLFNNSTYFLVYDIANDHIFANPAERSSSPLHFFFYNGEIFIWNLYKYKPEDIYPPYVQLKKLIIDITDEPYSVTFERQSYTPKYVFTVKFEKIILYDALDVVMNALVMKAATDGEIDNHKIIFETFLKNPDTRVWEFTLNFPFIPFNP
jgi:hypothetical protein